MRACVECKGKINPKENNQELPHGEILCETCADEILDIPAKAEREATRDSSEGVGEW